LLSATRQVKNKILQDEINMSRTCNMQTTHMRHSDEETFDGNGERHDLPKINIMFISYLLADDAHSFELQHRRKERNPTMLQVLPWLQVFSVYSVRSVSDGAVHCSWSEACI